MLDFSKRLSDLLRGRHEQPRDAATWLDLANSRDGHQRQAAVRALGHLRHGPAVRALLTRANDWVPQVRAAADQALRGLLDDVFLDDWLGALDAVVGLARAGRGDHRDLMDAITNYLGQDRHLQALAAVAMSANVGVKRFVFELQWAAAATDDERFELLRAALVGADVINARAALLRIEAVAPVNRRQALVRAACRSGFGQVRARGLRQALSHASEDTPSLARAMCGDHHALVRAIAFRAVQARGEEALVVGAAAQFLDRPDARDREKVPALKFLWTADRPAALRRCEHFVRSPLAALRRVAFGMLLAAASQAQRERLLLQTLEDSSAQVQRLASESVRRGALVPPARDVVEIGLRHGSAERLARALSMLRHTSTWTRLEWLLQAWQRAEMPEQKRVCVAALERWEMDMRNCFTSPTEREQARVRPLWQALSQTVPVRFAQAASIHLTAYGLA